MSRVIKLNGEEFKASEHEFQPVYREIEYCKSQSEKLKAYWDPKIGHLLRIAPRKECLDLAWNEGSLLYAHVVHYFIGYKTFKAEVNAVFKYLDLFNVEKHAKV